MTKGLVQGHPAGKQQSGVQTRLWGADRLLGCRPDSGVQTQLPGCKHSSQGASPALGVQAWLRSRGCNVSTAASVAIPGCNTVPHPHFIDGGPEAPRGWELTPGQGGWSWGGRGLGLGCILWGRGAPSQPPQIGISVQWAAMGR